MSYHYNLISDYERLAGFYEAIPENSKGIVYDIGTGSGILSVLAASYADFVYAVEKDPVVAKKTRHFLEGFNNISFIEGDASKIKFPEKADLILCEMLDTALIDEEQVPVLNSILKYLKPNGKIIPNGIINIAEPINMDFDHSCYEESGIPHHSILGPLSVYSEYDFNKPINPRFDMNLKFKIDKSGYFNGIKITTFTLITSDIICGPTPMLNPPLLIPIKGLNVKPDDIIIVNIQYIMGGGLNTIRSTVNGIL